MVCWLNRAILWVLMPLLMLTRQQILMTEDQWQDVVCIWETLWFLGHPGNMKLFLDLAWGPSIKSLADGAAELKWLYSLLFEVGLKLKQPSVIWCDNIMHEASYSDWHALHSWPVLSSFNVLLMFDMSHLLIRLQIAWPRLHLFQNVHCSEANSGWSFHALVWRRMLDNIDYGKIIKSLL